MPRRRPKGVPADLIEDVLRRVMRESYSSENDSGFKCVRPELRSIVVIGGAGQLGRLFVKVPPFQAIRSRSWSAMTDTQAEQMLGRAGMVKRGYAYRCHL